MSRKLLEDARMKAAATRTGQRTLDFYAVAFSDEPDHAGDIIHPRALDEWLVKFYAAGRPLPISFSHAAVLDGTDPRNIIGYAPADAEHVWVDDYGLRVRAILDMEDEKARKVAALVEDGVVREASVAWISHEERVGEKGTRLEGARIVLRMSVEEAGPTLRAMNPEAVIMGIKSWETVNEARAALLLPPVDGGDASFEAKGGSGVASDDSTWSADEVMSGDHDAAYFRGVSGIATTEGEPDQRQHWALPHHKAPGRPANAAAIRAARAAFGGARGAELTNLQNREAARRHIFDTHSLPSETASDATDALVTAVREGRAELQAAHDALVNAGAKCLPGEAKTDHTKETADRIRRLRLMKHLT